MLIPGFGVGIFNGSSEIELGNDVEFRSGVELAYQFRNKIRVGVAIIYLLNGGISSESSGAESLVISLWVPMPGN